MRFGRVQGNSILIRFGRVQGNSISALALGSNSILYKNLRMIIDVFLFFYSVKCSTINRLYTVPKTQNHLNLYIKKTEPVINKADATVLYMTQKPWLQVIFGTVYKKSSLHF